MTPIRALDHWLFAPGTPYRMAVVRAGLAVVIVVRVALGPYRALAGQPSSLFRPPPFLAWLHGMPPVSAIAALQIVGVVAGVLAIANRRPALTFPVAWLSLLVLAGLKTSLGKVLHNDVLLLLAAVPFLLAPGEARARREAPDGATPRYGWPVRAAMIVVSVAYFAAGVEKLVHSGVAWVTSDNMRWILYRAASGGRVHDVSVPLVIADRPWLAHVLAGAILCLELGAPLILISRRWQLAFVVLAAGLHLGTWATLGLDYWAWALTVAIVLVDWDAVAKLSLLAPGWSRHAVARD